MTYELGNRYAVRIDSARADRYNGTRSVNFAFTSEHGTIYGSLYIDSMDPHRNAETLDKFRQSMAGFGYATDNDIAELAKLDFAPMVGRECQITVGAKKDGKLIAKYIDGPQAKPAQKKASQSDIASIVTLFGGTMTDDDGLPF